MRNIHKYLWYKMIRNTDPMGGPPKAAAPLGRRRMRRLCFWLSYIINIYVYSLYLPYIFHIYFLKMLHTISLGCFLICGVKSRSGHDRSQSFSSILHVRVQRWVFDEISRWFCMVLHGEAQKNTVLRQKHKKIKHPRNTSKNVSP